MFYTSYYRLCNGFIEWSAYFDVKQLQVLDEAGYLKLVTKNCTKSSEAFCEFARALSQKRLPEYHYPELVEFCIGESYGRSIHKRALVKYQS